MFNSLSDIKREIYEFQRNTRKQPNVLFISKKHQLDLCRLLDDRYSWHNAPEPQYIMDGPQSYGISVPMIDEFGDITIFGLKVKWTENIDGVDYIPEFDKKVDIRKWNIKKEEPKIQNKKRKIIL